MKATCPECGTVYRIDPSKVPDPGVGARCMQCPGEFFVARPDAHSGSAPQHSPLPVPQDSPGADAGRPSLDLNGGAAADDLQLTTRTDQNEARTMAGPAGPGEPAEGVQTDRDQDLPPPAFGSTTPHERAQRLSRALVSDIVVYHPDRRARSLREGTIRQEFREEIRKSWDEYVAQVGNDLARNTSYFQEALNEILAGGTRYF